jgi:RNA polymerase sigma-70 factor (ECF subfamily)
MTEAEAVRLCRAGGASGQAAFRLIYDRHAPDVFRFQMKILRDAGLAEDAVQETFVRLHRGLGGFHPERPLRPWVLTIARNVAIDLLRSTRARPAAPLSDPGEVESREGEPSGRAVESERREIVASALEALDPEDRTILVLRHFEGLTVEEIARGGAITVRTAFNRLRSAALVLVRELRRRGFHAPEVGS